MNSSLSKISSWFGGLILLITVLYIILFEPSKYNPDYGSYKKLYDFFSNQDFRIYFSQFAILDYVVRILSFTGNYNNFRLIFAFFELSIFFIVIRSLKFKLNSITFFTSLSLSAFLLLKIHVQIREGLALLIWLLSLNSINKGQYISLKNFILFVIGGFLHTSTLIYWISTLILQKKNLSSKNKRRLIIILFFVVGLSVWPFFGNLISLDYFSAVLSYENIEITRSKIIYWMSFFVIFYLTFKNENKKITAINKKSIEYTNSSFLGNIGFYGFLGFAPIAGLSFFIGAPNAFIFNLVFRMIVNLLFLISFYRSSIQPKNLYTNILNTFNFIIIFRLLLMPNIN